MIGRGVLAALLLLLLVAPPASAQSTQGAQSAPQPCAPEEKGTLSITESWAQRRLDIKRVWPLTRGKGVTVGVVDSGVDLHHPQIQVSNLVDITGTGEGDCVGHGTAVAGIIAGRYIKGSLFYGVAPEVRLVSIKQTTKPEGDVFFLSKGIIKAVDLGAKVINVSVQASDHPDLRAAVRYAIDHDALIVAAVGNVNKDDGSPGPSFPAEYEGVLAVGAATSAGALADFSNVSTRVSVLGPGDDITSTWPGGSFGTGLDGTSYATPYVAGVAALVRSRFPGLDEEQVRQRIVATADGGFGKGTGSGMVNPLRAVTAILPYEGVNLPAIAPPPPSPLSADAVAKVPPVDHQAIQIAAIVAVSALCLAGVFAVGRVVAPAGRKRGWRPGRADVALRHHDGELSVQGQN